MNEASISGGAFLPNLGSAWSSKVGDFNGDGRADVLWRNSTTGENALWLMMVLAFLGEHSFQILVPVGIPALVTLMVMVEQMSYGATQTREKMQFG
ncbi:MAG: hypothetical protein HC907_38970 [Richelia sp. SM1_7_0]|nr:hypothetical protein [Richelia sp. SM1_7_0]